MNWQWLASLTDSYDQSVWLTKQLNLARVV